MDKISNSLFKTTALSLAIILTFNPLLVAAADLTVDPNSGKTSIGKAGNGVPVININAPNSKGLSHNKYIDYNVGKKGVILNNNAGKYTNTQLGGVIENNPNFNGRAAGTILNEVTSGNASRLQGYTEVAGQRANVIVANPNGITCSGCGFINTPRVTLTTGKPVINNGQLTHYDVNQGKITIEGEGLNAGNISQFDIISRTTQINAEIHAQKLTIIAGRNEVTHNDLTVTAKADNGNEQPKVAIDSSALGGMYAGAIRLVGTEKGVGVHLAGDMASHTGDIEIDANGKLTVKGTIASNKGLTAKASQIELENAAYAANDINLQTNDITINKSLASGGNLTVKANQITNKGTIEAGANSQGNNPNAQLNLKTKTLNNQGQSIVSRGSLIIEADQINNQKGKLVSKKDTQITTKQLNNQEASLVSEGKLTLTATEAIQNKQGNIVGQQGLNITSKEIDNSLGLIFSEKGDISLQANKLNNQLGNLAGQQLALTIDELTNLLGLIEAGKRLTYQGNNLDNQQGTIHALGKDNSHITLTQKLDNTEGKIGVNSNSLTLDVAQIDNTDGEINHQGKDGLILDTDVLGAAGGKVITQSAIHIDQDDWYNNTDIQAAEMTLKVKDFTQDENGKIYLSSPLTVTDGGDWYNDGLIYTKGDVNLALLGDYWGTGQLLSTNNIKVKAENIILEGVNSRIQGNNNVELVANDTLASAGNILANKQLNLAATTVHNTGTIGSTDTLSFITDTFINQYGFIFTGGNLFGKADDLYNQRGDIYILRDLSLTGKNQESMNALTNHSGTIETQGNLYIKAKAIYNAREEFEVTTRKISAVAKDAGCSHDCGGSKKDHNFTLIEVDRTEVTKDSPESRLVSGGNLTLNSEVVNNEYSVIASGANIQIDTKIFNNKGAQTGDVTTERSLLTWRLDSLFPVFKLANLINNYDNPNSANYNPNRNITKDVNDFLGFMVINNITKGPTVSNTNTISGIVQAAGTIVINAPEGGVVANDSIKPSYIYTAGNNRVKNDNTIGNHISSNIPINSQLETDKTHKAVDPLDLPGFRLPSNVNGVFHVNTNPKHNYLIETNPAFGLKSFLNSDYLLKKLGYNPDDIQKRLGDGFYEQRLIQQAIMARTGQYFLNGITDTDELYRYLMDNAISSQEALNLTVGVALTADQISKLTHDIVWMEERTVQGQKVLVPVIYMAQPEGRLAPTGSFIGGQNVVINVGNKGLLNNSGTIKADNALQAKAGNAINSGLLESSALLIETSHNIVNTGGGIIKADNISLATTGDGSVVNQRGVTTHQGQQGGSNTRTDFVSKASIIETTGNLTIITKGGGDIVNEGSILKAKDAQLQTERSAEGTGGDILFGSTSKIDAQQQIGKKSYENLQTTQYGSQTIIEGDLLINSGNNITTTGSQIKVGGNLGMFASNDTTFQGAANERHSSSNSKTLTTQQDQVTHQQSTITAGNIQVVAGNDINFGAATFNVGNGSFVAGNKINAISQQDINYNLYDKKTGGSGSFSAKQTKKDEITDVKNVGATFNVDTNLTFQSGGDQRYQAITINTPKGEQAGVVTFDSGGKIVFESVKDLHQESHERSKSDWSWNSSKGKGNTDETFKQTTIIGDAKVVIKAVDGLHIDIKDNGITPQTVSQAIDAMVKADPGLAWIKEAEQRGDVDWRTVKEIHDQWQYQNSGLGVGASIVIAIAAAAIAGPAAAGALAGAGAGTTAAAAGGAVAGSMAGTGAVSLVNNKGNLGDTLKDTFSKDNLKNYAVAGITAGITAGVIDTNLGGKSNAINKTTSGFDLNDWSLTLGKSNGVQGFVIHQGAQALNEAAVGTIINGGSFGNNLTDALKSHGYETSQAIGFNQVGNWGQNNHLDPGSPGKIIGHAVVGGTANVIMGGKFTDGATAAGLNEAISGMIFDGLGIKDKEGNNGVNTSYQQSISNIIGVVSGGITNAKDEDLAQLGNIAKNATAYNRQLHQEEIKAIDKLIEEDPEKKKEIQAAACYMTGCISGVSQNDPAYVELKALYDLGASNNENIVQIKQNIQNKYPDLFGYGVIDYTNDFFDNKEKLTTGIAAGTATIQGGATAIGSGLVCAGTFGLGCVLGLTGGLNQYRTGVNGLASLPIYEYKNGQSILDGLNGKLPTGAPPLPMLPTLTGKGNGTTVTGDRTTNKNNTANNKNPNSTSHITDAETTVFPNRNTTSTTNQKDVIKQKLQPEYANDTWTSVRRFELIQKDGVWYTIGQSGTMYKAKGTYEFVTINGKTYVSKTLNDADMGHYDIARGAKQVDYAGIVRFGHNVSSRGVVQEFNNFSGHYKPTANTAQQSGFPLDKFIDWNKKK